MTVCVHLHNDAIAKMCYVTVCRSTQAV